MSDQPHSEASNTAASAQPSTGEASKESLEQKTPRAAQAAKKRLVSYRQLLQNPNFRLLWLGHGITTFGSFFTRVAIPIYIYQLTGSYTQLGLSAFVSLIPSLLFGLFAGALVDRWDRRRTMIYADLLNCVLLCGLVAIVVSPFDTSFQIGALYVITFLTAILREVFNPARIAIFADVLPESQLLTANSLDQTTSTLGELLSYPLAAIALTQLGVGVAFGIDAASFLVSAVLIWGVKVQTKESQGERTSSIFQEIGEGLAIVNQSPILRKIVILSLIVPLTFTLLATLQLPFAVESLGSTEAVGFPALEGAMACGFLAGTLILGRWGQNITRWKLLAYGMLSFGLVVMVVGLVPHIGNYLDLPPAAKDNPWTPLLLLAMPLVFLQGATNPMIFTTIRTVTQEETPKDKIGRVASVIGVAAGISFSSGALLTGFGEGRVDKVITVIGIFIAAVGLFSTRWLRTPPKPTNPEVQPDPDMIAQPVPEQSF